MILNLGGSGSRGDSWGRLIQRERASVAQEIANSFAGERVVMIGGSSGFGLATAQAAAQEGASVVIVSRTQTSIDRALATLPDSAEGFAVDLRDSEAVERLFQSIGAFDHLVFTAGDALDPKTLALTTVAEAKSFFDLRFWGAYVSAKFGSPNILPGGSIVFTAGMAGWRPSPKGSLGASTSTALEGLTRALAVELAPIRVNLVIAGAINTPLWDGLPSDARAALFNGVAARVPAGRIGEADDIAAANLYLMRQKYSTGSSVVVDGGSALT